MAMVMMRSRTFILHFENLGMFEFQIKIKKKAKIFNCGARIPEMWRRQYRYTSVFFGGRDLNLELQLGISRIKIQGSLAKIYPRFDVDRFRQKREFEMVARGDHLSGENDGKSIQTGPHLEDP